MALLQDKTMELKEVHLDIRELKEQYKNTRSSKVLLKLKKRQREIESLARAVSKLLAQCA